MPQITNKPQNKFQFVAVSALRSKQLIGGAKPKIETTAKKWTTIAREEVRKGLVKFIVINNKGKSQSPD